MSTPRVSVQPEDFDPGAELARLQDADGAGAVASFLGMVRSTAEQPIAAMTLEHYPGMTENALRRMAETAMARFGLLGCTVIHRYGRLEVGARIVLVAAAASHRQAALDAVAFLMDWLKTAAPFWKKEHRTDGTESWVEARDSDREAVQRWT